MLQKIGDRGARHERPECLSAYRPWEIDDGRTNKTRDKVLSSQIYINETETKGLSTCCH